MKVAIQGEVGSFHAAAADDWADGRAIELVTCASFLDVFHALSTRQVDTVVSAVENTVYGSINEVYQLIEASDVPIVGELKLPIAQQLIGFTGTKLADIKEIYSHPVALAQCQKTLERVAPNAKLVEYFDTAAAVGFVKATTNPAFAAIASREAALLHQLPILAANIHDSPHNMTRFLVLSRQITTPQSPDRASLVVTTTHQPGALVEVLQLFAEAGINLAKLQSQPIINQPWQYKFFIVTDSAGPPLRKVIDTIRATGHQVKLLGEYTSSR